jgi:hypothetical protein
MAIECGKYAIKASHFYSKELLREMIKKKLIISKENRRL